MLKFNVAKPYPGIKCCTTVGKPVYDIICELAEINGYTVAQTLRILIRMGLERLGKEDPNGADQTDPAAACSAS